LGYEPNIIAQQLQKQRTDAIALILPTANLRFSDPFFGEFLSGIVEQATQHGISLLVSAHPPDDEEETYLRFIRSRRADGFIIVRPQRHDPRIDLLRARNAPFVVFGRVEEGNDFPFIDEDSELGIRLIIDHLFALGHTRLGFIAEPIHLTKTYHRLLGFKNGLTAHGLPVDDALIIEGGFRQRAGRLVAHQLFDLANPPTAIVACNDLIALGAITATQERGLVVGQDVSITGFDDIVLAEYANPPLTTIHQPAHQIGSMLCQMLVKIIRQQPLAEKQIILQPELVVRQSSGPVNKGSSSFSERR
jgi:LacI family transcriptional regulator